jgi:uncharacterized Ntn-hydrolase superfamily protein
VLGKGTVDAQGLTSHEGRVHAHNVLSQGSPASSIIEAVTPCDVDQGSFIARQLRQYGVVSLQVEAVSVAGWTGGRVWPLPGTCEAAGARVPGNSLASGSVLGKALEHHACTPKACGLAVALLHALGAGVREGGDSTCSALQSALWAFLVVAKPEDAANAQKVRLIAPDQQAGASNPALLLR